MKHPGLAATTETGFLLPPIIASGGSNGDDGPKSIKNPVFFAVDCQVTVVPVFTQNNELLLASGMLGVAEAEYDVRFISTVHGEEGEPHILPALHCVDGLGSEQAYLLRP